MLDKWFSAVSSHFWVQCFLILCCTENMSSSVKFVCCFYLKILQLMLSCHVLIFLGFWPATNEFSLDRFSYIQTRPAKRNLARIRIFSLRCLQCRQSKSDTHWRRLGCTDIRHRNGHRKLNICIAFMIFRNVHQHFLC